MEEIREILEAASRFLHRVQLLWALHMWERQAARAARWYEHSRLEAALQRINDITERLEEMNK